MKKWIEKDGKHVLVVEIYENETEILELKEDENNDGYEEPYFFYVSLINCLSIDDTEFFDSLEDAKKELEEMVIEELKDSIAHQQNIIDMLEE